MQPLSSLHRPTGGSEAHLIRDSHRPLLLPPGAPTVRVPRNPLPMHDASSTARARRRGSTKRSRTPRSTRRPTSPQRAPGLSAALRRPARAAPCADLAGGACHRTALDEVDICVDTTCAAGRTRPSLRRCRSRDRSRSAFRSSTTCTSATRTRYARVLPRRAAAPNGLLSDGLG